MCVWVQSILKAPRFLGLLNKPGRTAWAAPSFLSPILSGKRLAFCTPVASSRLSPTMAQLVQGRSSLRGYQSLGMCVTVCRVWKIARSCVTRKASADLLLPSMINSRQRLRIHMLPSLCPAVSFPLRDARSFSSSHFLTFLAQYVWIPKEDLRSFFFFLLLFFLSSNNWHVQFALIRNT